MEPPKRCNIFLFVTNWMDTKSAVLPQCETCHDPIDGNDIQGRKLTLRECERLGLRCLKEPKWLCSKHYMDDKRLFEWNDLCLPCGVRKRHKSWKRIPPKMKLFFDAICPCADQCCQDCYNDASHFIRTGKIRERERHNDRWAGFQSVLDVLRQSDQPGEGKPQEKKSAEPSAEDIISELRERVMSVLEAEFGLSAMTHSEECIAHMNEHGRGLFDIFHSIFQPKVVRPEKDDWSRVATVTLLDCLLHQINPRHSATTWDMTKQMRSDGVPLRRLVGWCHGGLGMHPCNLSTEDEKDIAHNAQAIKDDLANEDEEEMMVLDDLNAHHPCQLRGPDGRLYVQVTVGNVILKKRESGGTKLGLRWDTYGDRLLPPVFSPGLFENFFSEVVSAGGLCGSYMGERPHRMEEWCRVVRPYASRTDQHPHSPVTLQGVRLLFSSDRGFHKEQDMEAVLRDAVGRLRDYLETRLMLVTGDWHTYWVVLKAMRLNREVYGHLVPIPGAFHIALNAQQAIFQWYEPVVAPLWEAVTGKGIPIPVRALQRKNILDLLCRGWRLCRPSVGKKVATNGECNRDVLLLQHFFEEVLPVALDVYSSFLQGDWDMYESLLLRLLPIFAQFGKQNYVNCSLLLIGTVEHWKAQFPELYARFRGSFNQYSEEEIELFHSTVRYCSKDVKDAEEFAKRINVHGANMASVTEWNDALGVPGRGSGRCREWQADDEIRMRDAIVRMFDAALLSMERTEGSAGTSVSPHKGKEGWEWDSVSLGKVNDRAYPLPLQRNASVYGLAYVDISEHKVAAGQFDGKLLHPSGCGHNGRRGECCMSCLRLISFIGSEVMSALHV